MELKKQAISSVKWVTVATMLNNVIQFLLITVLARILSPTDFGLMALVQVVVEFASYFVDMGFSNIVIYKQDITNRQLSSLYWLNVLAGTAIFLIIVLLSPLLARFYNAPLLSELLIIAGTTFIIIPFGQQHKSLLQKELKFDTISKIDIISRIASGIFAIALGLEGFGVYSLVAMVLSNSVISTALFLFVGMKTHRPGFEFSHSELKNLYSFGVYQLGERTLNYFSGQFDTIIIGKLLGAHALGFYTIAKNLVMKPQQIINPIITRVTFPLMAKFQNDEVSLKKTYLNTSNYLAAINFPLHIGMAILAEPLTVLLFGHQWMDAVILVRILAVYAMVRSTYNPVGSLLLAKGRADLGFYWALFFLAVSPAAIFIGGQFGLQGISYAQLLLFVGLLYPFYYILIRRLIPSGFLEYHEAMFLPLLLTAAACIIPLLLSLVITNYIASIIAVSASGVLIYLFLSFRFNKGFVEMLKNFGYGK